MFAFLRRMIKYFIDTQCLKYVDVCGRLITNLTKFNVFVTPEATYYRDAWINIAKLFGNITIEQAKRETETKTLIEA